MEQKGNHFLSKVGAVFERLATSIEKTEKSIVDKLALGSKTNEVAHPKAAQKFVIKEDDTNKNTKYDLNEDEGDDLFYLSPVSKPKLATTTEEVIPPITKIAEPATIGDYEENESNLWETAHQIYLKDLILDIEGLTYVKCYRMKKVRKNLFSLIGVRY